MIEGVHQRCNDDCPKEACKSRHKWEYTVELPGIDGTRRRVKKGGFATAEARDEIIMKERKGTQPRNHKLTVAEWLIDWLRRQEELGLGEGILIDYKRHVHEYWIPSVGRLKLGDLRPRAC